MVIVISGYEVLIDDEDYEIIKNNKYYKRGVYPWVYFIRNTHVDGKKTTSALHRDILKIITGSRDIIDHVNCNTLDNRKINLRKCTAKENARNQKMRKANTSGYKGVSWNKNLCKWDAKINTDYGRLFLGYFENIKDAANAYKEASKKYHGESGRIS